jgi:type II secretory pathway component PulF
LATSTSEDNRRAGYGGTSIADVAAVLRFVRQFSVKLKAGLSPEKCLAALATETRHGRLRPACVDMRELTAKGAPLAQAMHRHRDLFDECVIGLVVRGEKTGKLRVALAGVADYLEARGRLVGALRGAVARPLDALSYVLLATFIAAVVLSFLVKGIIPVDPGGQHAVQSTADYVALRVAESVRAAWPFLGALGLFCFLALRLLPRHPQTRAWLDALAVKLPLIGPAVRATGVALFTRTVGICMQAGATLAEAMQVAAVTAPNLCMRQHIASTIDKIRKGRPYIDALVDDGFVRLGDVTAVQAAERRGELAAVSLNLAHDREQEAATEVKALRAVTHTLVVVLLGLAILGVVLTLYVPVFVAH